jgi:flavin-dependent dehydrogenase
VARGLDVVVLDKAVFPRDKVCAGWITPPVFQALGVDPRDYSEGRVLQSIHAFGIGLIGSSHVETRPRAESISFGILRRELDHYLLRRCGARLRLGEDIQDIRRQERGWLVNGELEAHLLVGAGGHFCPVARLLGNTIGRGEASIVAQEMEIPLTPAQARACSVEPEVPQLFFCADLAWSPRCLSSSSAKTSGAMAGPSARGSG